MSLTVGPGSWVDSHSGLGITWEEFGAVPLECAGRLSLAVCSPTARFGRHRRTISTTATIETSAAPAAIPAVAEGWERGEDPERSACETAVLGSEVVCTGVVDSQEVDVVTSASSLAVVVVLAVVTGLAEDAIVVAAFVDGVSVVALVGGALTSIVLLIAGKVDGGMVEGSGPPVATVIVAVGDVDMVRVEESVLDGDAAVDVLDAVVVESDRAEHTASLEAVACVDT
jgi:hypothetical protein